MNNGNKHIINLNSINNQIKWYLKREYYSFEYIYNNYNEIGFFETLHYWGSDVYAGLVSYLSQLLEMNSNIDIRIFHGLYEHKLIMLRRIEFILSWFKIRDFADIVISLEDIVRVFYIVRNLSIKYMVGKRINILNNITNILRDVHKNEQKILIHITKIIDAIT